MIHCGLRYEQWPDHFGSRHNWLLEQHVREMRRIVRVRAVPLQHTQRNSSSKSQAWIHSAEIASRARFRE